MQKLLLFIFAISLSCLSSAQKFTISGQISEKSSGEQLIGASVVVKGQSIGASANVYGFYSLTLPKGNYSLVYSFIGYKTFVKKIVLDKNLKLNIELEGNSEMISEVVVQGEKTAIEDIKMSTERIEVDFIKQMPAFLGEVDIMKSIQMLPGIQSGGEGSSAIFVRGGGPGQNLILLDEAPVYNASHLLGFFSVFNSDVIKDLEVYKGGIPAQYGGRLSSLIDIRMKDGNIKKLHSSGGIGLLSSKLTIEAPIIKNKSSFIVAGRRTYADVLGKAVGLKELKESKVYFYDLNAKINYKINDNNRLFLSGYMGRDVFGFANVFDMSWGNYTTTLRWNHVFNSKLFSNTTML